MSVKRESVTSSSLFFTFLLIILNTSLAYSSNYTQLKVNYFFNSDSVKYFPDFSRNPFFLNLISNINPNVGVEIKSVLKTEDDYSEGDKLLQLYNNLHKISSLKGLKYYSVTRGRMRVLFEDGYRVNNNGKPVADTTFDEIPQFISYEILKDDEGFGPNRYRVDYYYFERENVIVMVFRNVGRLRRLGVTLIEPQSFYTISVIKPRKNKIYYYVLGAVNTAGFFGLERRRIASFYNRINAILQWAVAFHD